MVRKKTVSELEHAEIRLEALLQKRGALNEEAQLARQERDMINEKKRELAVQLRIHRDRRATFVAQARAHRAKRDEYQAKAKALIELKRKLRSRPGTSATEDLRAIKRQIQQLELRQQTATLSLADENELIDRLKGHIRRAKELEGLKAEQDRVMKEVRDLDATITELFVKAEEQHTAAVGRSKEAENVHAQTAELVQAIAALGSEGDQKHEAYLEARAKADEVHAKVTEMRDKVLAIRGAARAEAREARDLLRSQNRRVRDTLLNQSKLEDSADRALKALLEKGRVEIR
jgi:uncharacterized coiled-coil DUF342 family protein